MSWPHFAIQLNISVCCRRCNADEPTVRAGGWLNDWNGNGRELLWVKYVCLYWARFKGWKTMWLRGRMKCIWCCRLESNIYLILLVGRIKRIIADNTKTIIDFGWLCLSAVIQFYQILSYFILFYQILSNFIQFYPILSQLYPIVSIFKINMDNMC